MANHIFGILFGLLALTGGSAGTGTTLRGYHHKGLEPLVVHIIPHAHCDVGYRATPAFYANVTDQILSAVTAALNASSARRFQWVEVFFLQHWWEGKKRAPIEREQFLQLLQQQRLELLMSGYVMEDEATTDLLGAMDQMTVGHQYVLKHFRHRPSNGWQIDPFGASRTTPTLFSKMGLHTLVHNRIPWYVKERMKQTRSLEFWWVPDESRPHETVFTHVLDTHYGSPEGFDWTNPGKQNPVITPKNVANRSALFAAIARNRSAWYRTPHILIPFGGDFNFVNATFQFQQMDALIRYMNAHTTEYGMKLRYSTVSEYYEAVLGQKNSAAVFPQRIGGDFFPLVWTRGSGYWTGFYRSIPDLKIATRLSEHTVRTGDALLAWACVAGLEDAALQDALSSLQVAREQCAILQHHDAITGTCVAQVIPAYKRRLWQGRESAMAAARVSLSLLMDCSECGIWPLPGQWNMSLGGSPRSGNAVHTRYVLVVNTLPHARAELVELGVASPNVTLLDARTQTELVSVIFPPRLDDGSLYRASVVVEAPAMSVFVIEVRTGASTSTHVAVCREVPPQQPFNMSSGTSSLSFDLLRRLRVATIGGLTTPLVHTVGVFTDDTEDTVYKMRAQQDATTLDVRSATALVCESPPEVPLAHHVAETMLHMSSTQTPPSWGPVLLQYRLSPELEAVATFRTNAFLGPVPVWSNVVSRICRPDVNNCKGGSRRWGGRNCTTQLQTDDNGLYIMERQTNESAPLGGQFYPVTAQAAVTSAVHGVKEVPFLGVLYDTPTGVASLQQGCLSWMLHRRQNITLRGNDTARVRSNAVIWLANEVPSGTVQKLYQRRVSSPLALLEATSRPGRSFFSALNHTPATVTPIWPRAVQLLSFQVGLAAAAKQFWIRLENVALTQQQVNLELLFPGQRVRSVQATTLTFNAAYGRGGSTNSSVVTVPAGDVVAFTVTVDV